VRVEDHVVDVQTADDPVDGDVDVGDGLLDPLAGVVHQHRQTRGRAAGTGDVGAAVDVVRDAGDLVGLLAELHVDAHEFRRVGRRLEEVHRPLPAPSSVGGGLPDLPRVDAGDVLAFRQAIH